MHLLSAAEVELLFDVPAARAAAELAFTVMGEQQALSAGLTHTDTTGGEFHVKTGGTPEVFGAKVNGAFRAPGGGLQIRGVIVLMDAVTGDKLAILDSTMITARRTAAATALAARLLARPGAATATIAGCGVQGRAHVSALADALNLAEIRVWSRDTKRAQEAAEVCSASVPDVAVVAVDDLLAATRDSDVVVTCTTAKAPLLTRASVKPGAFVGGVGADSPSKQELDPDLFTARVVVDVLAQAAAVGDLHHAIAAGTIRADEVHAELGQILVGTKPGRTTGDETWVYDATGTAIQDVVAARAVLHAAIERGLGTKTTL